MTDEERPDPTPVHDHGKIDQVDLQFEMQRSYLDYAMSVIVGRALPDVRDGLKPVHRRVIYGMYDGGFRPDKSFSKCARVVGEVMGHYHPHGDAAIYDALVRLVQPWSLRYPLALGPGQLRLAGQPGRGRPALHRDEDGPARARDGARHRRRDRRLPGQLRRPDPGARRPAGAVPEPARQRLGRHRGRHGDQHPAAQPARGRRPARCGRSRTPTPRREELLEALMERIPGPDFPTHAQILGTRGIKDAYRTGRGSITMRAVVNVEEIQGRTCLVITELPYQVNPDNVAVKISDLAREGKITGIADIRDETSDRTGQRLVIVLKRDAVAKVVLNNLYKHTQLQENFGANMLAIVDGVPRTLPLDGFITHWIDHQIEVIVRRTQLPAAQGRGAHAHPARLPQGARRARRGHRAHPPLADRRRCARRPQGRSSTSTTSRPTRSSRCSCAASPRSSVRRSSTRRPSSRRRSPSSRRSSPTSRGSARSSATSSPRSSSASATTVAPRSCTGFDGDMSIEDLIPEEEMVVTVTRDGYIKRTRSDNYRQQHRGGKGVKGAQLRADDVVEHFFVTTTHHWLLFFTTKGRVYRAKAYEVPEAGRDAKGQHVANLLALQPDEEIAQILDIRDYTVATYLVLATRGGLVKKTRLTEYDTNRQGGVIAIKLREDDEVVSALLVDEGDDILLISRHGMSLRFTATDDALRPMGRSTEGVKGMSFRGGDSLLVGIRRPGRRIRVRRDRGRVRQAHRRRAVPRPEPRRTRHQGGPSQRGSRRPRGRSDRRRGRRGLGGSCPAARWYALPWPRSPPRAATPWVSCSPAPMTMIASSRSRATASGAWPRRRRDPRSGRRDTGRRAPDASPETPEESTDA